MIRFHRHKWEVIEKLHTEPRASISEVRGLNTEIAEEIIFGLTTIVLRCTKCGDMKVVTYPGSPHAE